MLGTRIKKWRLNCCSHKTALYERATERHILEAMFLEKKGILGFERERGQGCVNLCIPPFFFFYGLKGLVFFLADKQKTALCVSVISLPGLAAKLASAAPSVELAPRSQCHTERAAFQTTQNWLCVWDCVCGGQHAAVYQFVCLCSFYSPCVSNADNMSKPMNMQHSPTF